MRVPDVTELPQGSVLKAQRDKVHGNPQAIRDIASAWYACSYRAASVTSALITSLNDVDKKWEGASADAFDAHMRKFPKAGEDFNGAIIGAKDAMNNVASALEKAHGDLNSMCQQASANAVIQMQGWLDNNKGKTEADALAALPGIKAMTDLMTGYVDKGVAHIQAVEESIKSATTTLHNMITAPESGVSGLGFFDKIPDAGGPDFMPGDNQVVWKETPYNERTETSGTGGNGSGGGGNGSGGGGNGGGGAPAPKEEVVKWIKEALTIIKSPEMAAVMRERGIDVSDLDPNDENDIKRIWTIIYHESGGNPNAINNWDINAKNGVPSQGLMQTIPPTFNAHSLPGHKAILNPVDNIIAGVLYTYDRYGNLGKHPGISSLESGGGYKPY